MTESADSFYPKDFIETAEGLLFAVVAQALEQDKVLCFLRYAKDANGWKKYPTELANALLQQQHPAYLHFSEVLDAKLHAVATSRIVKHHQPRQRLQAILQTNHQDAVERDLSQLCRLLQQHGMDLTRLGITGSLSAGTHKPDSDIDLVCYSRQSFQQCRALVSQLIEQGHLEAMQDHDWRQSFERRACSLSFADYLWHERRKLNKALINGRKFDLNFIDPDINAAPINHQKLGPMTMRCRVIDDTRAFDYPAEFKMAHEQIGTVVSFTATYTGQAFSGETIEASGLLEQTEHGDLRIVVGGTREARGEYIKVIHD